MPRRPGPCEHCGSPDRSRQCRYEWYLPDREAWRESGADRPCDMDEYAAETAKSNILLALLRTPVSFIIVILLLLAICYVVIRKP